MASSLLPAPEEREWILDELARLVEQCGFEYLICAPLLLPEPQFFPDRWTPTAYGVRRLALRLQCYAGLEDLDAEVQLFENMREPSPDVLARSVHHDGAAAYFAGITDDVCSYGADAEQLGDALGLTACMAHEVAHAFRAYFDLALRDPEQIDEEERRTDLTTVFLGAGVLTTNASARHRSGAQAEGLIYGGHQWTFRSLGYLSPWAMSFALAVVAVARNLSATSRRDLAAVLEPNQAASFKQGAAWLERERPNLHERLGIPANPADWPPPWPLEQPPLAELDHPEPEPLAEPEPHVPWNQGRPVFRVRPGYDRGNNIFAAVIVFVIGGSVMLDNMLAGAAICVLGFFLPRTLVRKFGHDRCSDQTCREVLPKHLQSCPHCGGTIAGSILGAHERLAAEERLADAARDEIPSRR